MINIISLTGSRVMEKTDLWACLWGSWGEQTSLHVSGTMGPQLNKKEEVSWTPAAISLLPDCGHNVTSGFMFLPFTTTMFQVLPANQNKPFSPSTALVCILLQTWRSSYHNSAKEYTESMCNYTICSEYTFTYANSQRKGLEQGFFKQLLLSNPFYPRNFYTTLVIYVK